LVDAETGVAKGPELQKAAVLGVGQERLDRMAHIVALSVVTQKIALTKVFGLNGEVRH
jgi:hypothetical protein